MTGTVEVALGDKLSFLEGTVNSVAIGSSAAAYALGPSCQGATRLLVTDASRNSYRPPPDDVLLVVPEAEQHLFAEPEKFWMSAGAAQFHDYAQQSRKVPVTAHGRLLGVREGDEIDSEAGTIRVIDTPGRSSGAVSYVLDSEGTRVVLVGDLLYGNGLLLDLYCLQDAVPEANARGYHGYAARAGQLITSLLKVSALEPDVLLPAHGPAIFQAKGAIAGLVGNLESFLELHFETDALLWYWGAENHRVRSRAVRRPVQVMPLAELGERPPDISAFGTSRLIRSGTGGAFLVDAGDPVALPVLRSLRDHGAIDRLEGVWITHYHDDHTDYVNDVVEEFGCTAYHIAPVSEVIENPGGFHLPCLPSRAVRGTALQDGSTMSWHEWQFTFEYFPGQTLHHGGFLATRDDGSSYYFVGDSFTPTGIDDYCMQNRNLFGAGLGYGRCLNRLRNLPAGTWLLNQHVEPLFRFSNKQIDLMLDSLTKRARLLEKMSPWPDVNYLVDESWSTIYPYASSLGVGDELILQLRVCNFAPNPLEYTAAWHLPEELGLQADWQGNSVIPPGETGEMRATLQARRAGLHVATCEVSLAALRLSMSTEALVRVE